MERASANFAPLTFSKVDSEEFVVKKLCQHIRQNMSDEEWDQYEGKKDSSRIQLFLERKKEIQSCVHKQLKLHPTHKDKEKAMILKNAGNKAFGSGDNHIALDTYTKCLAMMPQDGTKDTAVVYANRSAALFHLEEFELSKQDAEIAFNLNYPKELHYKLFERLGKCCLNLNNAKEATKNFEAGLNSLHESGLDDQKMKKTQRALEELLKNPPNLSNGFHQTQGSGDSAEFPSTLPDIAGGRNKYLRAASSRLTLQYREKQGRFVIANEGFKPGDVILVEKAFVSVLLPEFYNIQCFQCLSPMKAPIVCPNCILVSFCSIKCKNDARKHHQYECSILGLLKHSGVSVICYMALRIFTQEDPKKVLGWFELAEKSEEREISKNASTAESNNCQDKMRTLGFNEEYRTDHVALFNLVTHSEQRKAQDSLHQIVMALYLFETLSTTTYFDEFKTMHDTKAPQGSSDKSQKVSSCPTRDQTSEHTIFGENGPREAKQTSISQNEGGCQEGDIPFEVKVKFCFLLLRCIKALTFNTHETNGWDPDRDKDNSVGLGGGLFPTLALFNHSCNPSIVRYFVNNTVVVRAIKTIMPGEVVTENYGANYSTNSKEERQARLLDYYWFECDCIACREDWPKFDSMTNDQPMKFRCGNCGTFICKSDESMGLLFKCGKCGKSVNILKTLKTIHETDTKYTQAVNFINNGQMETGLGMLLENLFLLESALLPPFKEYHMCQEYIRRCYLNLGNKISKLRAWDPELFEK